MKAILYFILFSALATFNLFAFPAIILIWTLKGVSETIYAIFFWSFLMFDIDDNW